MRYRLAQTFFVLAVLTVAVSAMAGFRFRSPFPFFPDDIPLVVGGNKANPDWEAVHETADADQHNLTLLNEDGTEDVVIAWDDGIDWGVSNSASLRIHSTDAASPTEYISLRHDLTNGELKVGSGGLNVITATNGDLTLGNTTTGGHDININVQANHTARLILLNASNQRTIFQSNFSMDQTMISSQADGGRQLILTTAVNSAVDHDHDAGTDPVFYVHSATNPNPTNTEYVSLMHDQTDARIHTGKGQIRLTAEADKGVVVPIEEGATLDAPCVAANEGAIMYFDDTDVAPGGFCGCVNFDDGGGTFGWAPMTSSAPCP